MAIHQAPLSLGFSGQEHWSGLPLPSPMHESEKWKVKLLSHGWLFATPWTAAYQAPPSMGFSAQCCVLNSVQIFCDPHVACQARLAMEFSRQDYWSRLLFPTPGDLPKPGIKPTSLPFTALADIFFTTWSPGKLRSHRPWATKPKHCK